MGEADVLVELLDSFLHRSSSRLSKLYRIQSQSFKPRHLTYPGQKHLLAVLCVTLVLFPM